MPEQSRQEWLAILDRLELTVATAAAANDDDGVAPGLLWDPPTGLGPIPADLVERARRVQNEQQRVIGTLQAAARDNRQHHALIGAVNASTPPSRAVYLDVAG